MIHMTFRDREGREWKRVDKRVARNAYARNGRLVLCACNMIPFGPWHTEVEVTSSSRDFDALVNDFEYHNCSHPGEGAYASYYVLK